MALLYANEPGLAFSKVRKPLVICISFFLLFFGKVPPLHCNPPPSPNVPQFIYHSASSHQCTCVSAASRPHPSNLPTYAAPPHDRRCLVLLPFLRTGQPHLHFNHGQTQGDSYFARLPPNTSVTVLISDRLNMTAGPLGLFHRMILQLSVCLTIRNLPSSCNGGKIAGIISMHHHGYLCTIVSLIPAATYALRLLKPTPHHYMPAYHDDVNLVPNRLFSVSQFRRCLDHAVPVPHRVV